MVLNMACYPYTLHSSLSESPELNSDGNLGYMEDFSYSYPLIPLATSGSSSASVLTPSAGLPASGLL